MLTEAAYLSYLVFLGLTILPSSLVDGWIRPAFGLIVGCALAVCSGTLLLALNLLDGPWHLLVTMGIAAAALRTLTHIHPATRHTSDVRHGLVGLAASLAVTSAIRSLGTVSITFDSISYLAGARLIAQDSASIFFLEPLTFQKRMLAVQSLHAPMVGREGGAFSLGPLLLLAIAALSWWMIAQILSTYTRRIRVLLASAAAASIVLTSWILSISVYVNSHILVAALCLAISALFHPRVSIHLPSDSSRMWIAGLLVGALVLSRVEGAFLAALLLAPVAVSMRSDRMGSAIPWLWLGVTALVWNSLVLRAFLQTDTQIRLSVLGMFLLALVAISVPVLTPRLPRSTRHRSLSALQVVLWGGVLLYAMIDTAAFTRTVRATLKNLLWSGGWGPAAVAIALLVLLGLWSSRHGHETLWFPVTAFVPLGILLGFLRGGPYRVGVGDSLNRMWTHIVPLAVVFGTVAVARRTEEQPHLSDATGS